MENFSTLSLNHTEWYIIFLFTWEIGFHWVLLIVRYLFSKKNYHIADLDVLHGIKIGTILFRLFFSPCKKNSLGLEKNNKGIHQALLQRNAAHLRQAPNTPFAKGSFQQRV